MQFTQKLSTDYLDTIVQNKSAVTILVGESASEGDATAMTIIDANYIPGTPRLTSIIFDFKGVNAWHAPAYEDALGVIEKAEAQTITFEPKVNYCCALPVEERARPNLPDDGRDLTKLAIIVILVVVVLGALLTVVVVTVTAVRTNSSDPQLCTRSGLHPVCQYYPLPKKSSEIPGKA